MANSVSQRSRFLPQIGSLVSASRVHNVIPTRAAEEADDASEMASLLDAGSLMEEGTPASMISSIPDSPASSMPMSPLSDSARSSGTSETIKPRLSAVETEMTASRPRMSRAPSGDDDDGTYRPQYVVGRRAGE